MSALLANPTKTITLNFPIEKVKECIRQIPNINKKYVMDEENEIMDLFTLGALEFLSLGIFADISLTKINETTTQFHLEIRRKIGAFDESYEVQKAGTHIRTLLTEISNLLKHDGNLDEVVKLHNIEKKKNRSFISKFFRFILFVVLGITLGIIALVIIGAIVS